MSATVVEQQRFNRFKDAPWFPSETVNMIIGGAGGIGSWLSILLSRAGFSPVVYDFDTIEGHNIGGQLFMDKQVGEAKAYAIAEVVRDFGCGDAVTAVNEKYDESSICHKYMFSAFDNMEARKTMFHNWLTYLAENPDEHSSAIFIDGRLGLEHLEIYCVAGDNIEDISRYQQTLFDDAEVEDAPCTMKQTSHTAAMIASHMVALFTNHHNNVVTEEKTRVVPFTWQYFTPINLVTEE